MKFSLFVGRFYGPICAIGLLLSMSMAWALSEGPVSYSTAVERAAPAVVNVFSSKTITRRVHPFFDDPAIRQFFGDSLVVPPLQQKQSSLGSGVIVSEEGYILTNNHVVAGADEIQVALRDGRSLNAKIVGTDPDTDLALLKVKKDKLPVVPLGDSDQLKVGDVVLAIGNPFGVGQTVTLGIVSATGRSRLGLTTFENFIQTDAAINPGNSGGALVNAHGELVGINTAIFSRSGGSQGIGFAIPIQLATGVQEDILEFGSVVRGWLGLEAQNLTAMLAESFGLSDVTGTVVAGVFRDGPADRAGLKPGDVLYEIGTQEIKDNQNLMNQIASYRPGEKIVVKFIRDGKRQQTKVEIGRRPSSAMRR
jgi:serine protease DegS